MAYLVLNPAGAEARLCRSCASILAGDRCGNCGAVEVVIRYWRVMDGWTARMDSKYEGWWSETWGRAVRLVARDARARYRGAPLRFRVLAGRPVQPA
jgi:hypothetical protein